MGRLGYYSKLSGQAPKESDPPKKILSTRTLLESECAHIPGGDKTKIVIHPG